MSAPIRFLAIVVIGWAGVRAMTLGALPGFTVGFAKPIPPSRLPPIVATSFPPLPPVEAAQPQGWPAEQYEAALPYPYYRPMPPQVVYYMPYAAASSPVAIPPRPQWHLPSASLDFAGQPPSEPWELASLAPVPHARSTPVQPVQIPPSPTSRFDRVQVSSWALLRGPSNAGALASGGTLGGSQAGARLNYNFNRWLAASLRTTSPLGGSGGVEVAAGVRVTPLRSIPVAITAERRQTFGRGHTGRSAFALLAEGGLYHRPMPWKFSLDAYLQAGIVGLKSRDYFVDGAVSVSRPVWGRFSAGFGMWGGAQPGIYRIDAGPRVSIRVRDNIYAHVDWRQRIAGSARPSSGPALTLAADF